jgi:hypothetical protein
MYVITTFVTRLKLHRCCPSVPLIFPTVMMLRSYTCLYLPKTKEKINCLAMTIFPNPFQLQWLIFLPTCEIWKIISNKMLCFSYKSTVSKYLHCNYTCLIESYCVLCEVRIECNADSLFICGSTSRETSSVLLIPNQCIVRVYDCLSASNCFENEQHLTFLN